MAIKYVLNAMKRRKLRTFITLFALTIGIALVGALLALVDTQRQFSLQQIGDQTGGYDLDVRQNDLAASPFFDPDAAGSVARRENPNTAALYARIQGSALARTDTSLQDWSVTVVALDVDEDKLNRVKPILEGNYPPKPGQVFLTSLAADLLKVKVGEEVRLSYIQPTPRERGKSASSGGSSARADGRFIVSGIGIVSGLSSAGNAVLMRLPDAQAWLGQTGKAERLLVVWNSDNNAGSDAKVAVSTARDRGQRVRDAMQQSLGPEFTVGLPKYAQLEIQQQAFVFQQSFITIYGLLSMGIIGLMVNALMMTTVAEQKKDLAVLRVLGAPRRRLLQAVVLEVVLLGVVSLVLGVLLGRAINDFVISPLLLANLDLTTGVRPAWTLQSVLTPTIITAVVLALATIQPAQQAASTKMMVVLNPAAADQPTLEDLAKLRERRAPYGLLIAGAVLLALSFTIFFLFPLLSGLGDLSLFANVFFGALMLMVIGMSLVFYFTTTPIERVLLKLFSLISKRSSFFATRYSLRGKGRNALISLMVTASAVLPCLLAAQLALTDANIETDVRFGQGADATATTGTFIQAGFAAFRQRSNLRLDHVNLNEIQTHPGVQDAIAISNEYSNEASDRVSLRTRRVRMIGVTDDLNKVLFPEYMQWSDGDASALKRIMTDRGAVVISTALRDSLDVALGDTLKVKGAGQDHDQLLRIVGVASSLSGFQSEFTSNRNNAQNGATGMLMHIDTYRELRNDPIKGKADSLEAIYNRILIKKIDRSDVVVSDEALGKALRDTFSRQQGISISVTREQVAQIKEALVQGRIFTVVLAALSLVTAVFGVLAVMYTAVMGRRIEIGMLKALGSPGPTLRGVFMGEAVVTTLAAAIAGIVAGTILGVLFVLVQRFAQEVPTRWAFDFPTALVICVFVVMAAAFSSFLATQPVLKRKAIHILRER